MHTALRRTPRRLAAGICCYVLAGALSTRAAHAAGDAALKTGLEAGTVQIVVCQAAAQDPEPDARGTLGLRLGPSIQPVTRLDALRNTVSIRSAADALRFVRLRTAPATFLFWGRDRLEVEIIPRTEAARLPSFGLRTARISDVYAGHMGVLSDEQMQRAHLSPACVGPCASGFSVNRWLLIEQVIGDRRVQSLLHVRETVGTNGAYHRVVLEERATPSLPGVLWAVFPVDC